MLLLAKLLALAALGLIPGQTPLAVEYTLVPADHNCFVEAAVAVVNQNASFSLQQRVCSGKTVAGSVWFESDGVQVTDDGFKKVAETLWNEVQQELPDLQ